MIPALLILATLGALAVGGTETPQLALVPVLGVSVVWALSRLQPRLIALGLVGLVLVVESPQDRPADGLWESPLYGLGELVYLNIGGQVTLPFPAPFSLFELWVLLCAFALLWRRMDRTLPGARLPPALGVYGVLGVFLLTVVTLLMLGMARGGLFQGAYWQVRQLALLPAFGFIFHESLRVGRTDLKALGALIVGAACFKGLLGVYFHYAVAVPQGLSAKYATTHPDSLLFVGAVLLIVAWLLHRPTWAGFGFGAVVIAWLLLSIHVNDRRIAWMELGAGLAVVGVLAPKGEVRRRAIRTGYVLVPMVALYMAAGWNSTAAVFAPVQALVSVDGESDSSTFAREVENYNMARTIQSSPLFGQGFGHPYREVVKNEIWRSFELYRYIPHNSIYTLLMIGGLLGFLGLWLPLPFAVFYAVRALRERLDALQSCAALLCVSFVLLFALQAWGDMGTQSYPPVVFAALALAVGGRLAVSAGTWPSAAPKLEPAPQRVPLQVLR